MSTYDRRPAIRVVRPGGPDDPRCDCGRTADLISVRDAAPAWACKDHGPVWPAHRPPSPAGLAAAAVAIRDDVALVPLRAPVAEVAVEMALRALTSGAEVEGTDPVSLIAREALDVGRAAARTAGEIRP